jgi:hypothetical protein
VSTLTLEQRRKLPEDAFALPERRLFPVLDADDVAFAARLADTVPEPERAKVKRRVLELCVKKGLTPPPAWKGEASMSADANPPPPVAVEFSAAPDGKEENGHVLREVPVIFRAGAYEFRDGPPFEMTPEEVMAFATDFSPVEIDDNHRPRFDADGKPLPPSIFKGKLGRVTAVKPAADYTEFGGTVELPKWLHDLYRDQPLGLSARWDRATKKLIDVALTPTPRITDAVLFAAFAESEEAQKPTKGRDKTPHGQKMMQFIHDHTAMHGAVCKGSSQGKGTPDVGMSAETGDAPFTADHERDALQKIHDLTLGSGAACAIYREGMGKNKTWKPGQYYDTAVETLPRFRDYQPGNYAAMSADSAKPLPPPAKPEPIPRERELEARLAEAERKTRAAEAGRDAAAAVNLAAEFSDRLTPAQTQPLVALARLLGADDREHAAEATFSVAGGGERRAGRLDLLRAVLADAPPHYLTEERTASGEALFALGQGGKPPDEAEEAKQSAEKFAAQQNALRNVARGKK